MYSILKILAICSFGFILISCGASTDSRYEKKDKRTEEESKIKDSAKDDSTENFDLSKYHARIDVPEIESKTPEKELDIWYEYDETDSSINNGNIVLDKKDGYRVQVYSTDDLDEANNIRSELYFKTNQKNVYIIFDPPFYKIKVGDFLSLSDANQLNFKLNQLGYSESRVVKDSVNIYQ